MKTFLLFVLLACYAAFSQAGDTTLRDTIVYATPFADLKTGLVWMPMVRTESDDTYQAQLKCNFETNKCDIIQAIKITCNYAQTQFSPVPVWCAENIQ